MEPKPELEQVDSTVDEAQSLVDDLLKVAVKTYTVQAPCSHHDEGLTEVVSGNRTPNVSSQCVNLNL